MGQIRRSWQWIRLGGLSLRVWVYVFYARRGKPKLVFLQSYYTIPKGKKFLGKTLAAPYVLQPGWILGWRYNAKGEEVWYHARSLYDLVRSFAHALTSEQRAQASAEVSIDVAIELARDLLAYWPLTPSEYRALTIKLGELETRLRNSQNPDLQDADDAVLDTVGFRDAWGRPNPGASAAKIYLARRRITARLGEIMSIVPNLSRLQVVAAQELSRVSRTFLDYDLETLRMVSRKLPRCAQENHLQWVISCLRQVRADCETAQSAPFYNNARYIESEIGAALIILTDKRRTAKSRASAARPIVRVMIRSLAFKRAQRELEGIIRELSMSLNARGNNLTAMRCEMLARTTERYIERARGLCEDSFKRKRLARIQNKLASAAQMLRANEPRRAKVLLKQASALL